MLKPYREILPPEQNSLWSDLSIVTGLGFVLYGGTAIALRLGHRQSVDFDFFTENDFDTGQLANKIPFFRESTIIQNATNTLSLLVSTNKSIDSYTKVSFFGGIGFGRVGEPDLTDDGILCVASLDDLLATKLAVILQRPKAKDYMDIAAMLISGLNLAYGMASAQALYGNNFQPSTSLKALVYYEDGDLFTLDDKHKKILISAVSAVRQIPQVPLKSVHLGIDLQQIKN
ncbi:MAG: nucleotidyl transferase AbiEii/AbiGii toxin family protein [Acidimicrobiales bacterium]|nr:nucleotidyl transferase AbiEii/AbiGii toxin family protein [Acidimicrobiales bacterium]